MSCLHCAAPLADGAIFCPSCGTPALNPATADLHRRAALLNERWAHAEVGAQAYERETQALMRFDAYGRAWLPGGEPGIWRYYQDGEWRPFVAPLSERMASISPPAPSSPAAVAALPTRARPPERLRRRPPWGAILGGAAGLVLFVILVVVGFRWLNRPAEVAKGVTPRATAQATVAPGAATAAAAAALTPAPGTASAGVTLPPLPLATSTPGPPKPTMTPISRVSVMAWGEGESALPLAVWNGAGSVVDGAYCLRPSGEQPVRAGFAPGATDLSLQALVAVPNLKAASAGLLGCGVLFEINRAGQWRQRLVDRDGAPEAAGEWRSTEGLGSYHRYDLGLLCESGAGGKPGLRALVANGLIVSQDAPIPGSTASLVGLYASIPAGAADNVRACMDNWRLEVWPGAGPGHPADDRQPILAELGQPHAFSLAFEQEPEGGLYRVETWTYADVGMSFTFVDGVLIETAGVDTESPEIVVWPVNYDPLAFTPDLTLEQVKALLGGQELVSLEAPAEFGEGMIFYAGDQIVLGFTQGTLEFVETLPITVASGP
jgi:hypothetical protein